MFAAARHTASTSMACHSLISSRTSMRIGGLPPYKMLYIRLLRLPQQFTHLVVLQVTINGVTIKC
jgi:hypothetical protein